ncbi:MAG: MFS transporter [Gemmatimonadales bacterium]|nr:MFS transporter [Gemmatimonadales bacterium]
MPPASGSLAKFALIFCLYLSQGIATSFLVLGVPSVLRNRGMPLDLLWVAYLPVVLYSIKFLWAPLADRHWVPSFGRRRTWLVPATLALAASFLLLAQFPPDRALVAAAAAFFLISLSGATMDIATDAYAVELLDPGERGLGNGLQSAGLACGGLIGRGAVLVLIDRFGWTTALTLVAILIPIVAAPGLLRREPPVPGAVARDGVAGVSLRAFFARPETPLTLLLALLTGLCYFLSGPILGPFLVDAGLSLGRVGVIQGVVGTAAGIIGALAAGASVNRLGFKRAYRTIIAAAAVMAILAAAVAASPLRGLVVLALIVAGVNVVTGGIFAVFYANVMNWCAPAQAATDFTAISSVFSLMAVVGGSAAGFLAKHLGYSGHFLAVAAVAVVTVAVIGMAWPRIPAPPTRHP